MTTEVQLSIDPERVVLGKGAHSSREAGMCIMEFVAFLAHDRHTDTPECACPVVSTLARGLNDVIDDDATRTRLLKPHALKILGSRSTPDVERKRADLAVDWIIREYAPAWLELAGLKENAAALRALPEVRDIATLVAAQPVLVAAQEVAARKADAARDAAWAAARDAARDAAWAAAWAAAWDAARDAAWAAAWDAARDAARDAAWAAARDAARDALQPTVTRLQESAAALIGKMLAITE